MTVMSYGQVLSAARQMPPRDQIRMAEALLRNLRAMLASRSSTDLHREALQPLTDLSYADLRVLADTVVAPDRQERLHVLLERNQSGDLSPQEQRELDALIDELDRVALLKARALYTLQGMQSEPESMT